ncbi:hypothetical protein LTR78_000762 [Recurvomyces mirabilis]|uniref:FAD-binding domain-containing protein n=1 Tax=Recurvomyces mirabilis TaxID=574656 RepID=A0AAE0WVQ8_9PEZI|nr:hypothetical protein LTR78_000762 [Recurvomyces mirabilis]KAK5158732.1 hypothetical protein LTS14_002840 [Recurvomyces mirabilis]
MHTDGMSTTGQMDEVYPVLIVGAGPAGATLALHLGRLGIKTLLISKHHGTANTPRAHIFNQRAMEVLRDARLEERLSEVACDAAHMAHTPWSDKLNGTEYGRMWSWGNKPGKKHRYEMASPCRMSDLPQSYLEPILVGEAAKAGKQYPVLDTLGIIVDGKQLNTALNVHIQADLSRYMENRPGSLNWVLNTEAPEWSAAGNFRMVRPWNEWLVSMHPANIDGRSFEPTNEQIQGRLKQMVGDNDVEFEILSSF